MFVFVHVQYSTENMCSCSFVFDTLEKMRVRVRSCSRFSRKNHVRVRSCSVFSRNVRVRVLFAFMFVFGIMESAVLDQ